jgi:hypothetical protein
LISRVRDTVLGAQAHQDIPHEVLSRAFSQDGIAIPEPRVLALHTYVTAEDLQVPPWKIATEEPPRKKTMPWGMTLQFIEEQHRVTGYLHYSTDLYDPVGADALLKCFLTLATEAAADPQKRISALAREIPKFSGAMTTE